MKIILATQNSGKLKEFNSLAQGSGLEFIPIERNGNVIFPEETGKSFFENALIKANYAFSLTGKAAMGDDSGLEVDALRGKLGVHSSRFSKESTDASNINKLLKEMEEVKEKNRTARFKCCLVLITNKNNPPLIAEGLLEGKISKEIKGNMGFGYDPVFIPKGSSLHMAELENHQKNLISHRANAFKLLLNQLN